MKFNACVNFLTSFCTVFEMAYIKEVYTVQDFKTYLSSMCISEASSKILLTGDNQ